MLKDHLTSQGVTGNTITNMCSLQRVISFPENSVMSFRGNYHWTLQVCMYMQELQQAIERYKIFNNLVYSQPQDAYRKCQKKPLAHSA